ncbi:MAG: winged helix DNA-binding protein [Lentisphaeria bacterium]|nr:winged helix DNA-binding protein [Lentisphaeria bacterium]
MANSSDKSKNKIVPDVKIFKQVCRILELKRRNFLIRDWKKYEDILPQSQFARLMLIRFALPCNLTRVMELTGLTSAGASLFVDKLVNRGILCRIDDPEDRRNIYISATPEGKKLLASVEQRLDEYICNYFKSCTPDELADIARGMSVICSKIGKDE